MAYKKILPLLLITFLFIAPAFAWESQAIVDITPSSENRYRDTTLDYRLVSNESSQYNVNCYMTYPNGTEIQIDGTKSGKLAKRAQRSFIYQIKKEKIDQFGDYIFTCNESVKGVENSVDYSIVPRPKIEHTGPLEHLYLDVTSLALMDIDVRNVVGEPYANDTLKPGVIELYKVNNTGKTLLKTLDNVTTTGDGNVKAKLNMSGYSGKYDVRANFSIQTCDTCNSYEQFVFQGFYVFDARDFTGQYWGSETASSLKQNVDHESDEIKEELNETESSITDELHGIMIDLSFFVWHKTNWLLVGILIVVLIVLGIKSRRSRW